jgi:hypothetical protein
MKKWLLSIALVVPFFVAGCQPVASHLIGLLYTNVKGPVNATEASGGTREGKACAQTILGLVATGDASIEAAMRAGGIKQASSVNYEANHILGIVGTFCTVVRGN